MSGRVELVQASGEGDQSLHEQGGNRLAPVTVTVIEDDPAVRAHIVGIVAASARLAVVGEAESVAEAVALLDLRPGLMVLDLGLIDGSGIEVIRRARAEPALADMKILVLTLFSDEERVLSALTAGADGYLLKDTDDAVFLQEIFATLDGSAPISSAAAAHLLKKLRTEGTPGAPTSPPQPGFSLTPREIELLQLLAKGLSYKLAAQSLGISPNTVGDYVKSIYRKMDVNSRSEAVFEAINTGMIRL